jgi:BlaI family penicillinase repressor
MEKLTKQESEAMLALWNIQKGTARQILDAHDKPLPHYSTLRSTLENLKEKNYLAIRPVGNTNEYIPLVKEAAYKKQFLSDFVKNHFSNSYKELVAFFAQEKNLTEKDLSDIMDIIKTRRTK